MVAEWEGWKFSSGVYSQGNYQFALAEFGTLGDYYYTAGLLSTVAIKSYSTVVLIMPEWDFTFYGNHFEGTRQSTGKVFLRVRSKENNQGELQSIDTVIYENVNVHES